MTFCHFACVSLNFLFFILLLCYFVQVLRHQPEDEQSAYSLVADYLECLLKKRGEKGTRYYGILFIVYQTRFRHKNEKSTTAPNNLPYVI